MGLDMSVYRVSKPFLNGYEVYDIDDIEGIIFKEKDSNNPMFRQLVPYCVKVRVMNHYYDLKKIGEDYNITDVWIGGWCCDENGSKTFIHGNRDGKSESVTISDDLIKSKYIIDREEACYVCASKEMRYWRKAYDIQEWIHENLPEPVENTGYYILTEAFLDEFNKTFPEDTLPTKGLGNHSALVYWEWY